MSSTSPSARVADAIRDRVARIAVIGQGHVGLPLAVELARAGYPVVGIDTGQAPTPDVASEGLQALLREGRYGVTPDFVTGRVVRL